MLTNDEIYTLACNAVKKMFQEKGKDFLFPFDLIWKFTSTASEIPSTKRPSQVKKLLSGGYIEKTGGMVRAASPSRAGSATPEYRFGSALLGGPMRIIFLDDASKGNNEKIYPSAILTKRDWDDFGFQTSYSVKLLISPENVVHLGDVKILNGQKPTDQVNLKKDFLAGNKNKLCSLGQSLEYYEKLLAQGHTIYNQYLTELNDVVFNSAIRTRQQENIGFRLSLVRFASATQALSDAPSLFGSSSANSSPNQSKDPSFIFKTKLSKGADTLNIDFDFKSVHEIPNRLNVIIGYNGTGKTQLLSNLATVVSGYGYETKRDLLQYEVGSFLDSPPNFGGVIVVSYSAFDTFKIPGIGELERKQLKSDGGVFGYTYCGLRKLLDIEKNEQVYGLKNHKEIQSEYENALRRIWASGKNEIFLKILKPISVDASFQRIGFTLDDKNFQNPTLFSELSTGHKIVLTIIAQLTAFLEKERRMLVIMDEPEAHLHPPLLAALLHSIRVCMEQFDAYAIIATHSPVVLQETPARFIRILQRVNSSSVVAYPSTETFGENVGVITQDIFNLDYSAADFNQVLINLANKYSLIEIEQKFGKRLGFSARSQVMSLIEDR